MGGGGGGDNRSFNVSVLSPTLIGYTLNIVS